jgi:tRNA nucleotidyltransferase (CCA-adding enzyme)
MAKAGMTYPQVEARVTALMDGRVVRCPADRRVADALRVAQRAAAEVVVLGRRRAVRRRDLERAARWGLGGLTAGDVGWDQLATVPAGAPEILARRLLIGGAPLILVWSGGQVVGAIDAERVEIARATPSLVHRLDRLESRDGEARVWLLRVAGKLAEDLGTPVFAVGGFARDLLLDRAAPDVDLLVEGDGVGFARRLREEIGGGVAVHETFGTASIEGTVSPSGRALGRIDIASARRERYDAPGALPVVRAAAVEEDLRRRDFSVNALAVALRPSAFGRLLDPLGGRLDLGKRRLRPLHPLSFVEDPTRIFRAARYAARLGFRLDALGMRAVKLALAVRDYPALSGQRLRAELDLLAAEPRGWRGFTLLLGWKALRLWDPDYEGSRRSVDRVRAAVRLCRWARQARIEIDASEVILIALLADHPRSVVTRCLARLALDGERGRRVHEAAMAGPLARRLDGTRWRSRSDIAEALCSRPVQVLAGAWLCGGRLARRRIEWFLRDGRTVRPALSGDDVLALGVPRGPAVGECLAALRRLRLDRLVKTRSHERAFVEAWLSERVRPRAAADGGDGSAPDGRGHARPTRAARTTRHARTRREALT